MANGSVNPTYYADFNGLAGLRKSAKGNDPDALRQVARQFESLFTSMMLKSMREAKLGDGLGDSQETELYQGMFDQQLALQLSQGKGIGLADLLVRQLSQGGAVPPGTPASAAPAAAPAAPASTSQAPDATPPVSQAAPLPPAAPAGNPATLPSAAERTRFIQRVEPYAEQAASQLGVAPEALIAQAALETGWGRHLPGDPGVAGGAGSANLFGIKAGANWTGPVASAVTTEYVQGSAVNVAQPFRAYGSLQQGMDDYVSLLQGSARYQGALRTGGNVAAFASALQRGGYATDPAYAQKLAATAENVRALRTAAAVSGLQFVAGQPTPRGGEPT